MLVCLLLLYLDLALLWTLPSHDAPHSKPQDYADRIAVFPDIEHALRTLEDEYITLTHADRSVHPPNVVKWRSVAGTEFGSIPEMWRLQNLCVLPDFQRRGLGAMLMAWGKDRATEEGCAVGMSSSMQGQGLYLKQGFRRYATMRVEGFPMGDVPVFLWEPPGLKGKWGDRGEVLVSA